MKPHKTMKDKWRINTKYFRLKNTENQYTIDALA